MKPPVREILIAPDVLSPGKMPVGSVIDIQGFAQSGSPMGHFAVTRITDEGTYVTVVPGKGCYIPFKESTHDESEDRPDSGG